MLVNATLWLTYVYWQSQKCGTQDTPSYWSSTIVGKCEPTSCEDYAEGSMAISCSSTPPSPAPGYLIEFDSVVDALGNDYSTITAYKNEQCFWSDDEWTWISCGQDTVKECVCSDSNCRSCTCTEEDLGPNGIRNLTCTTQSSHVLHHMHVDQESAVMEKPAQQSNMTSGAFSAADALQLAKFSSASYCSQSRVMAWSCSQCKSFPDFVPYYWITGSYDGKGFLGYDDTRKQIILAFQGSTTISNWVANLNFFKLDYDFPGLSGARVHGAWYRMAQGMFSSALPYINQLLSSKPDYDILVTGHSLGGANAELVALMLRDNLNIVPQTYTYGAPRVGNAVYSRYWNERMGQAQYRLTNKRDPVPALPPNLLGFHHRATEVFMGSIKGNSWRVCDGSGEDQTCHNSYILPIPLNIFEHLWYMDQYLGVPCF